MKTENITLITSLTASGAVTKNRFVTYAGAQAGAGVAVAGVSDDNVTNGQMFPNKARGWLLVESGGAVAQGAAVESDASARAVTRNTGEQAGRAVDAATAAGQLIRIDR
jgi:hypothetical protein